MAKYITPKAFLTAFKEVWDEERRANKEYIIKTYEDDAKWTNYILGKNKMPKKELEEKFLYKVMEKLNKDNKLEYWLQRMYTIDLVYASGRDLYETGLKKSEWQVLIEHENSRLCDEETEMYKLIFMRAPLKVIIFHEVGREEEELNAKLKKFREMLVMVNTYFQENENTNYLFIVGNNETTEDNLPHWRYATLSSRDDLSLSNLDDIS